MFVYNMYTFIKMVTSQCKGQPCLPHHLNPHPARPKPSYIKLQHKKVEPTIADHAEAKNKKKY